ncbi:MAG: TRAP transporter substrate-binding protein [Hungatella sp.]|jgi:tripartite ATP-independent transporter DctP family solute receptor|nr:TRAP transporter substrate-binding protein [Hungatella sp.]
MSGKKIFLALALAVCACTVSGCSQKSSQTDRGIVRISLNQSKTYPHFNGLDFAGKEFTDKSGGRFEFLVYPNEVLGDQRASLELVQNGAVEMAVVNGSILENFNKDFAVVSLPYLYDSLDHQKQTYLSGICDELFTSTEQYGFRVVAAYTAGFRNIYTTKPIRTPDDLQGMKIRVMQSDTMIRMMNMMGGNGTPMSSGEVYTAMQQKVVDGAENNEIVYVDSKHLEVAPVYSLTMHAASTEFVVCSTKFLNSLSEKDRADFLTSMQDSITEEFNVWNVRTEEAKEEAIAQGASFIESDAKAFQKNCLPLHEEVTSKSESAKRLYDGIRALSGSAVQ